MPSLAGEDARYVVVFLTRRPINMRRIITDIDSETGEVGILFSNVYLDEGAIVEQPSGEVLHRYVLNGVFETGGYLSINGNGLTDAWGMINECRRHGATLELHSADAYGLPEDAHETDLILTA